MARKGKIIWIIILFVLIIGAVTFVTIWIKNINEGRTGTNETAVVVTGCNATYGCDFAKGQLCNLTTHACYLPEKKGANIWMWLFFVLIFIGGGFFLFLLTKRRVKGFYKLDELVKIIVPWLIESRGEEIEGDRPDEIRRGVGSAGSVIGSHPYYVGENHNFPRYFINFWRRRKDPNMTYPDGWKPPKHEIISIDVDRYNPLDDPIILDEPMYINEYLKHLSALKYGRIAGMPAPTKIEGPWTDVALKAAEELQKERTKEAMGG